MKSIQFSANKILTPKNVYTELSQKLEPEIGRVQAAWGAGYKTDYASLSLPSDEQMQQQVKELAAKKKQLNPSIMVVVGIGGSYLGTMAIHQALHGFFYNEQGTPKIYFADTVDARYISAIHDACERALIAQQSVLIVVVSKSGATTETIANAQLFLDLLQKHDKSVSDYVVVISDEDSALWNTGKKHGMDCLPIPEKVGGRYSVLSPVGLFPLAILGVDIDELCAGAESMKEPCSQLMVDSNPAAHSALVLYHYYHNGYVIHDTFAFGYALYNLGEWYRQLTGESLGKAYDRQNKKVNVGITPTVSIGTVDLHTVAQLYLAGPYNRITTFVQVQSQPDIPVPSNTPLDELVPMINGKTMNDIMQAVYEGTQRAYEKEHRPFMTIELPDISAYSIGQLLQMKMVEIMYLGFLFNINPFDQPAVELYKKETRKLLSHE